MQEKRGKSGKSEEGVALGVPHKLEGRECFYVVFLCSLTQERLKFSPSFWFFAFDIQHVVGLLLLASL